MSNRFRNHTLRVYHYLFKEFSAKTAYSFLDRLEKRIDFIVKNPMAGKLSVKRQDVRSILFTPHTQIYYQYKNKTIVILCLFDMRKNPKKKPYWFLFMPAWLLPGGTASLRLMVSCKLATTVHLFLFIEHYEQPGIPGKAEVAMPECTKIPMRRGCRYAHNHSRQTRRNHSHFSGLRNTPEGRKTKNYSYSGECSASLLPSESIKIAI